jgi:hypothetical protein
MDEILRAGRYRIEEKLGEGGMGIVYRARDSRLDCRVALKEIKPQHLHDPQYRARLAQEARAAAAINHPGIARSLDYVDDGKEVFVVYEFVEGVTLRQRLAQSSLPTEDILDIAIKVADSLAGAHQLGFIHRDLKPENVMLASRPDGPARVKILDFGLTKRLWVSGQGATTGGTGGITTDSMAILGTLDYMSPEQVRAEKADERSDIYSLGVVIYEMAAGVNPFSGGDPGSTIAHILTLQPPGIGEKNSVSPPELDRIVQKCLRKKREERFQSVRELLTALSTLRQELDHTPCPVSAPPPPSVQETPLQISRGAARGLFLVTQVGYLAMYLAAVRYLPRHLDRLWIFGGELPTLLLAAFLILVLGAVVRVYFLSAVGFDYSDSGRLYQRILPFVLALDLAWSAMPLLLFKELGWISWLCVVGLAFLPFSQRALMCTAYAPRGGRTSGIHERIPA